MSSLHPQNTYQVKTGQFEGPLELLLHLIEKRKLFINDISLSQISDDYIEVVRKAEQFPKEDATSFILIASTLILLKSRSLLPNLPLSGEEEEDIEDLENRLREYKRMKELALHIEGLYGMRPLYTARLSRRREVCFSPDNTTTKNGLLAAIQSVLAKLPTKEDLPKAAIKAVLRLEDVMDRLSQKIASVLKMSFREFHGAEKTRAEEGKSHIIVSFIALLELIKSGTVTATQDDVYGDITMETQKLDIPHYNNI